MMAVTSYGDSTICIRYDMCADICADIFCYSLASVRKISDM
jgi:hypothetical protein